MHIVDVIIGIKSAFRNMKIQASETGRPQDERLTAALLEATLVELAERGYEGTTISRLASRARTSKQAVYRRWPDKVGLVAAAIEHAFARACPGAPQRGNVARDLRHCLLDTSKALQETPLGDAVQALTPYRKIPELDATLSALEDQQRLLLRQIFIATPFETDMETRIDLLLGLIYFKLHIRGINVSEQDVETAINLVLGLIAPRS